MMHAFAAPIVNIKNVVVKANPMLYLTSEEDFKLKGEQFIYFYAPWMPYHKKMVTMISKIEKKYNINFCGIDTDYFKNLYKRFNVDSIPTILILNEGNEIKRIKGLILTSAFKNIFVDIYKNTE